MGLNSLFLRCERVSYLLKEILFKNSIFFILGKSSNYSFTKYTKLGSLYVLINGDSEYVSYILR